MISQSPHSSAPWVLGQPLPPPWRTVPSTLHAPGSGSVRVDIVTDGTHFHPAMVASDILPDCARLMVEAHAMFSALETLVPLLSRSVDYREGIGSNDAAEKAAIVTARGIIARVKGVES